jgi:hypothetical protein
MGYFLCNKVLNNKDGLFLFGVKGYQRPPLPCPAGSPTTPPALRGRLLVQKGGPPLLGWSVRTCPSVPGYPPCSPSAPLVGPHTGNTRTRRFAAPSCQGKAPIRAGLRPRSPAERVPPTFPRHSGVLRPCGFAWGGQGKAPGLPVGRARRGRVVLQNK